MQLSTPKFLMRLDDIVTQLTRIADHFEYSKQNEIWDRGVEDLDREAYERGYEAAQRDKAAQTDVLFEM